LLKNNFLNAIPRRTKNLYIIPGNSFPMERTEKFAEILTSTRIKILKELKEEKHPQELAERMRMTRQGVDKHLSILYKYGLVEKRVKFKKRPMIFYILTPEGEELLGNIEDAIESFILSIRNKYKEEIFNLDRMLVDGKIEENTYWERRRKMEERFSWVKDI